jgi:cytochrome d ubiquinol oxidase subunit I
MRTRAGVSSQVSAGNALFTLLGFLGLYTILGILFLFLVYREIEHGPAAASDFRGQEEVAGSPRF